MEGDEASSPEISSPEEGRDEGISEYERQRLSRIKENRARLEALGLPQLASSLIGSLSEHRRPGEEGKGKKKAKKRKGVGRSGADDEDDEEYQPSDEDNEEEEDDRESSSSSEQEKEKDKGPPSGSRRKVRFYFILFFGLLFLLLDFCGYKGLLFYICILRFLKKNSILLS